MRDQPWKMAVGWIGQGLPGGLSWCARARGPSGLRVRTLWFIHYDLAEKLLSATKKSKNTFAALSLAAGQHRCFGKLLLCFVFSSPFQNRNFQSMEKSAASVFCCPVQRKQFVMLLMHVTENTTEVGADHVAGLSLSGFAFVMNPGCWLQFTGSVGIFLLDRGLFSVDELILRLLYAVRS